MVGQSISGMYLFSDVKREMSSSRCSFSDTEIQVKKSRFLNSTIASVGDTLTYLKQLFSEVCPVTFIMYILGMLSSYDILVNVALE